MNDKHDPNASVPIGTFKATTEDGEFEIPVEIVTEDDIDPGTLAIQSRPKTIGYDEHIPSEGPRRKRVQTLMGVALPGATLNALPTLPAAHDPTKATNREIASAIDDALDEQPTGIYGYKRESTGLKALESMLEAQMIEMPPSASAGEIVGVVGRESPTGTFEIEVQEEADGRKMMPVLAPKQFVEARARDARGQRDQRDQQMAAPRTRTEPQPLAASPISQSPSDIPTRSQTDIRVAPTPAPAPAARPAPAAAPVSRLRDSEPPKKPAISSLAPTEIPKKRAAAQQPRDSSFVGYGLVAAMVLLGIGGWWLTAGGYRRGDEQAAQPTAAASVPNTPPDSLSSPRIPAAPAPAEPAVTAPFAEEPAPTPDVNTPVAPREAKPRVAAKAVRKPVPAPALVVEAGPAETPTREDVKNGLDRVRSSVQACAEGRTGVAEVDVTIAHNGVVTNALVGGDFGGTPQGSCIARAVRRAKFPTFKQDRYRVLFPYVL